jgi:hypothetical protein
MTDDEASRRARELGLERLAASYPQEIKRALEAAAELARRLPPDIHWTEEPAHVFSRQPRKGGRP